MENKKFALVVPNNRLLRNEFCESYYRNIAYFSNDMLDNFILIVVDDYSPYFNENLKVLRKSGLHFEYWSVKMQIDFFKKSFGTIWEKYWEVIPHRTDACRSFGYIIAALRDSDVIITADDDNYALTYPSEEYNYLSSHDVVNSTIRCLEVSSSNNWFNTISMLKTEPDRELYARGYSYSKRSVKPTYKYEHAERRIAMNVGLWIGNPDVDSVTVLSEGSLNGLPITKTIGFKDNIKRLVLAKRTFAPLNTANTAYSRKVLPIIYDTFQGAQIGELKLDRFGDIWCNLFIKRIFDETGDYISIGTPLVEHRREPRNTFEDLKKELWGLIISEKLYEKVEDLDLYSHSYADLYKELIENLQSEMLNEFKNMSPLIKYFNKLFNCMLKWLEILEKLGLI